MRAVADEQPAMPVTVSDVVWPTVRSDCPPPSAASRRARRRPDLDADAVGAVVELRLERADDDALAVAVDDDRNGRPAVALMFFEIVSARTGVPATTRMRSPAFRPAAAAGRFGSTVCDRRGSPGTNRP